MLLKELNDPQAPVELRSLARYYQGRPDALKEKLRALIRDGRLLYAGQRLFDQSGPDEIDQGSAYEKVLKDCQHVFKDADFTVDVSLDVPIFTIDGEKFGGETLDLNMHISEGNDVYLGYDPSSDALYVGYDLWLEEEDFNEQWDKWFLRETRYEFDGDDHEHAAIFDIIWKQFMKVPMFGAVFRCHHTDAPMEEYVHQGGFYKGIYPQSFFKRLGLIDLRLG